MKIDITYSDHGLLSRFRRISIPTVMRGTWGRYAPLLLAELRTYPSPPASSTYRRTGALKAGWRANVETAGVQLVNQTPYAGWVQDERTQTGGHRRTGWPTAQAVARKTADRIVEDLAEGIQGAMEQGL